MSFGRVVFLFRNPLAGLPIAIAIWVSLSRDQWSTHLWIAGLVIALAGLTIRAWAACLNTYGRGATRHLATSGPYGAMRNPLYLGSAFIISGACLATGSIAIAFAALPWAIAIYHVVVLREESRLSIKHTGDYANYFESVPRWIPRRLPFFRPFVPPGRFARALLVESVALLLLLPTLLMSL